VLLLSKWLARSTVVVLSVVMSAGCGSSATAGDVSVKAPSPAQHKTCQQVSAVLSDGPDPGADPVGYAEAQILPLRQIQTSDRSLSAALVGLADAFQELYASGGSRSATRIVKTADSKLDAICPGATS
jgi:hypothetical protein